MQHIPGVIIGLSIFMIGQKLGRFEIVARLGAGGMGEVYRARDPRLDRDVAVKVLPQAFAADRDFRERFEREAKAVAALSHPNIVQIYELGTSEAHLYAAMELLDGETLRTRLDAGPLPIRKALDFALQIVHGLAAAHARGVVHRDLKPDNIFITRGGRVKILDFGLAKVAMPPADVTAAGTASVPLATAPGMVLGTVGYMSPEQVRAAAVDQRTDLFSFGVVLFEMLTGRRAFAGPSAVETMHAILSADPLDSTAALPEGAARLIRRCLEKSPEERFHSAHDLGFALDALSGLSGEAARPANRRVPLSRLAVAAIAFLAIAAAAAAAWLFRPAPPAADPVTFHIVAPVDATLGFPAVSPDGTQIAFLEMSEQWPRGDAIWIRRSDALDARKLVTTNGASAPFWSPDSRALAFVSAGKLRTIDVATGRTQVVCDAASGLGGAWGPDGTILFSPEERSAIYRVDASGGTPVAVTTLDAASGDESHRWPQFLPGGRHFLYVSWNSRTTVRSVTIGSLHREPPRKLFDAAAAAVVADGDYLIFAVEHPSRLMAQAFDAGRLTVTGQPFQLVPDSNVDFFWYVGHSAASAGGSTLAYTTGKYRSMQLTWFSRQGGVLGTVGDAGSFFDPAISADGARVAFEKHDFSRGSGDIWTADLERGGFTRVTSDPGFENVPVWSPDGRRIAFSADRGRSAALVVRDAGGGEEQVLVDRRAFPLDWSADGRYVLFMASQGNSATDIHAYDTTQRTTIAVAASAFAEEGAAFSPDGKWVAYSSNESERRQVYLRSFPDGSTNLAVSTAGGVQPRWRGDGKELFYVAPDNMLMTVDIDLSVKQPRPAAPRPLFKLTIEQRGTIRNHYAVSRDGQRILVASLIDRQVSPLVAVLNWRSLIPR